MAEVNVQKGQGQAGKASQGSEGGSMTAREPMAMSSWGRMPSLFAMTPRELFSASPFELMRRFSEEMDRFFEGAVPRGGAMTESRAWAPPIEVSEQHGNYVVCAELPGIRKEDVKVELTQDGLVITGERKREQEERREGLYRSERSYGSFYRLVPIPEEANIEQAKAQFDNGVLTVSVPMPESKRRRREIPIETGGTSQQGGGTSRAA